MRRTSQNMLHLFRRWAAAVAAALALLSFSGCCANRFEFPVAPYRMPGSAMAYGRTQIQVEFPKPCPDESLSRPARELSERMESLFAAMERRQLERTQFEAFAERTQLVFSRLLLLHEAAQRPQSEVVRDGLSELRGVPVGSDQLRVTLQELRSTVYDDTASLIDDMDSALSGS